LFFNAYQTALFVDKIPSTLPTDGQTYTSKNC
jgi:hypothetical protein